MLYQTIARRILGSPMPMGSLDNSIIMGSDDSRGLIANNKEQSLKEVRISLNSTIEADKLTAMRSLIRKMAEGKDTSTVFSEVVNNIVSKNPEIRKLVYLYLMRYAEENQELALLPFASLQNLLKMANPVMRATSIRVLSSMRVQIVLPVILLCLKEAVNDICPYVRRTVAFAIAKLYSQDKEQHDRLIPMLQQLLSDQSVFVVGGALHALKEFCPENLELLHPHYRRICGMLSILDEWTVVVTIKVLLLYAHTYFPNISDNLESNIIDSDHQLLITSAKPLFNSQNPAIICAVSELFFHVGSPSVLPLMAAALVNLLLSGVKELQYVVLHIISPIVYQNNDLFRPYLSCFFVYVSDSIHIKLNKLRILTMLASDTNISCIIDELQSMANSNKSKVVILAIQSMGQLCSTFKYANETCLPIILDLISSSDDNVCSECIVVLKSLIQRDPKQCLIVIDKFIQIMDKVQVPEAIATILWLVGEFADYLDEFSVTVLKRMLQKWDKQAIQIKSQILSLSGKLYVLDDNNLNSVMLNYCLRLAHADRNFDLRDRASFIEAMLLHPDKFPILNKHAKSILFNTKMHATPMNFNEDGHDQYSINSMSHILSTHIPGYNDISCEQPDKVLFSELRSTDDNIQKHRNDYTRDPSEKVSDKETVDTNSTEGPDYTDTDISALTSSDDELTDSEKINKNSHIEYLASLNNEELVYESDQSNIDNDSIGIYPDISKESDSLSCEHRNEVHLIDFESIQDSSEGLFETQEDSNNFDSMLGIFSNDSLSCTHIDLSCLRFVNIYESKVNYGKTKIMVEYAEMKPLSSGICRVFIRTNLFQPNHTGCYLQITSTEQFQHIETLPDMSIIAQFIPEFDDRFYTKVVDAKLCLFNKSEVDIALDNNECISVDLKFGPRSFLIPEFINEQTFIATKELLRGLCEINRQIYTSNNITNGILTMESIVHEIIRQIGFGIVSIDNQKMHARLCGITLQEKKIVLITIFADDYLKNITITVNSELSLFANLILDELEEFLNKL